MRIFNFPAAIQGGREYIFDAVAFGLGAQINFKARRYFAAPARIPKNFRSDRNFISGSVNFSAQRRFGIAWLKKIYRAVHLPHVGDVAGSFCKI